MESNEENLLTVSAFAKLHGVSRQRINKLIIDGKIEAVVKFGKQLIDKTKYPKLPTRGYTKRKGK